MMMFHPDEDHEGHEHGHDHHGHHGAKHGWGRQARRGDMRLIVLHVLQDQPMHGYEIIRHLEDKSHGLWRPSAGSIYPTLQLLEEEDLIKGRDDDGKRIYEITAAGREQAKDSPMEHWRKFEQVGGMRQLHMTGFEVMHQLKQIARSKSEVNITAAAKVLDETKAKLSAIIGDDETSA